jgi:hypothetical protein
MVIRRKGRDLPPATEESKAEFRARFSDDDRITFHACWEDAKWGFPKRAVTALSDLAEQYSTYLGDVAEVPVEHSMWDWKEVRRGRPRGTADAVRRVWFAWAAVHECIDLLKDSAQRPTDVKEAIGAAVIAFLPLLAESNQILGRLRHQHTARSGAAERWARTASARELWQQRAAAEVKDYPAKHDTELYEQLRERYPGPGFPAKRTLLRYLHDARA